MKNCANKALSSPKDRYHATLASGYGLVGLQILLTLASVPLALSFLGKEGFGIWALATQVSVWLLLLDGGMNGALARHLIDHRQDPDKTKLRHCVATGFRVLCAQGLLILGAAYALGVSSDTIFDLTAQQSQEFGEVITLLGVAACIGFFGKIISSWLYACQRLDVCNIVTLGGILVEFALLWFLLNAGCGLASLAWARLIGTILNTTLVAWYGCRHTGFPTRFLFGAWNTPMFRELATFGGGMFLLTLGTQLLNASQTALVAKFMGLGAATIWATAPKLFQIIVQLVSKLWDYRVSYLSLLMAQNNRAALITQFSILFRATAYIGGCGVGVVAAINPIFLSLWTRDTIHWAHGNDWLMALILYLSLLIRCFTDFLLHTKKVGWMPILMLAEGVLFIVFSVISLPRYGITGMLVASLSIGGMLRLPYALRLFHKYLCLESLYRIRLLAHAIGGLTLGIGIYILLSLIGNITKSDSSWLSFISQTFVGFGIITFIAIRLVLSAKWATAES